MIKTFFQFEKKQTLLYILKYIKQKAATNTVFLQFHNTRLQN